MKHTSFREFAKLCAELEGISSNLSMRDTLASYLKGLEPEAVKFSSYFLLGRIGPEYEDIDLGIGDKMALQAVCEAFDADKERVKRIVRKEGDLGEAVKHFSVRKRSSLSIGDVERRIRKLKNASGKGSQEKKISILSELLSDASAVEAKYIMRIVLGSLRIGVGDMTILEAFAVAFTDDADNKSALEDGYNVCPDLGRIGESVAEHGLEGVKRFSISLGRPIKSMLAQRVDEATEILEKIDSDVLAAEEKYDGERVQVHKDGKDIILFSRRLDDITHQFPDLVEELRKSIKVKKAVLDGEIVAYKGKILPFQKLMQRRRKYDIEEYRKKIPVVVFLFDALYVRGRSLLNKSYPERRDALEKVVERSVKVRLANRKVSENFKDIRKYFEKCVKKGLEGIIVKSTAKDSTYQPGKRGWHWIKWKKEYAEGMQDTFDVVVVGSYHGKGQRKGFFGALLCALYNKKDDVFETFTKVGTGFTDEQFKKFDKLLSKFKVDHKPARLKLKRSMKPDVFYEPYVVIEIMGAEITRSPSHTAGLKDGKGLALRFPRFLNLRDDKKPTDATTVREAESLR